MNANHRRSIRLKDYDYALAGAYFVTLCTYQRECLFGDVNSDGKLTLTDAGQIVAEEWECSALIRKEIELDAFVVIPNHVHGIVVITAPDVVVGQDVGAHGCAPLPQGRAPPHRPARSLGSFIAGFKSAVTTRINTIDQTAGRTIWQRNYYEHIVRNERDLNAARKYIENNPLRWALDRENPGVGAHGAAHSRAPLL